jgi:hypothetical protein
MDDDLGGAYLKSVPGLVAQVAQQKITKREFFPKIY